MTARAYFHAGPLSRLNWNLEICWGFQEGEWPENPERNPWSRVRTNNNLNPLYAHWFKRVWVENTDPWSIRRLPTDPHSMDYPMDYLSPSPVKIKSVDEGEVEIFLVAATETASYFPIQTYQYFSKLSPCNSRYSQITAATCDPFICFVYCLIISWSDFLDEELVVFINMKAMKDPGTELLIHYTMTHKQDSE